LWIQLFRAASGGLAALLLGKGLDLSTDTGAHALVTYLGFYGGGGICVLLTVWLSFVIHEQKTLANATNPRTRPLTWGDLRRMRVPVESHRDAEGSRSAKRAARHIHAELDANRKRVNDALDNGHWWNVMLEGLQTGEWTKARDLLADEVPPIYDALAPVYVLVDAMNTQANNHAQGGRDAFDDDVAKDLRSLRSRIRTTQNRLKAYYEAP
jgi:hypothetical protein